MAHSEVYTQYELGRLHKLAVDYVKRDRGNDFGEHTCDIFYRNKPPEYFKKCRKNNNTMRVYMKDDNGDPKSAINGRIKGLFFATGVDQTTGQPTKWSHFGTERVSIPSKTMLRNSNLYFADFYCKCDSDTHYVTMVLTKPGSKTDRICKKELISLNIGKNDFLWRSKKKKNVHVTSKVWVEVFYTEDVDLSTLEIPMTTVPARGSGSSTPGGITKDPKCLVCNLHDESDEDTESDSESDEDIDDLTEQFGGDWND